MDRRLFAQAVAKFLIGALAVGLLLFIPAGTLYYWNGWLFMALLFVPMSIAGIVMMFKAPELLRRRLNAKEKEGEQRTVVALGGLMFLAGFVAAGLNYRFQWLILPKWAVIVPSVIFLAGYVLYGEVLRENAYLSRTVEVQEGQKVIDTGLYGVVRHPMYFATLLLFLSMPLILGSVYAFLIFLFYPAIIVKRIHNEEQVLERDLEGYGAYREKVKYRLLPLIW